MITNTYLGKTTTERFWSKVKKTRSCWLWLGAKSPSGHGQISISGKMVGAHRFSYELHNGSIPKGIGYYGTCVCHSCDNPQCVNPKHLWTGTQRENLDDMVNKGRIKGERHPRAKLTQRQVDKIRKLYSTGKYTQRKLGLMFGVNKTPIGYIINKINWK
jgi:hypothetical protein